MVFMDKLCIAQHDERLKEPEFAFVGRLDRSSTNQAPKKQLLDSCSGKPGLNKVNIIRKIGVPSISLHVDDSQVYNSTWKQPYAEKYML